MIQVNMKEGPYKRTQIAALFFYLGGAGVHKCRGRRGITNEEWEMNLFYLGAHISSECVFLHLFLIHKA